MRHTRALNPGIIVPDRTGCRAPEHVVPGRPAGEGQAVIDPRLIGGSQAAHRIGTSQ